MNLVGSGTVNGKIYGSASLGTLAPTTSGGIEIDLLNGGDSTTAFTGAEVATVQLVVRKDTSFNWGTNNPILAEGEIAYSTDDKWFCIGDGVTEFNDLDDSHFYVNWLDILNFVNSQTSGLETSIGNIQSDISTLQSDISSVNSAYTGLLSQIGDIDGRTDTLESQMSTAQYDISAEDSTRSTAVTYLQGQIDTINTSLTDGLLKKYTLEIPCSDIDSNSGVWIDLFAPSNGFTILPISANAQILGTTNKSSGISTIKLRSQRTSDFIFNDVIINDTDTLPYSQSMVPINNCKIRLNDTIQLFLEYIDSWDGSNSSLKLNIFYLEV